MKLKKGDYVLATKYSDGDPCDHFCVGFFDGMLKDNYGNETERYIVIDSDGARFRHSGFRRCERISKDVGDTLVSASPFIGDRRGYSLWYWRHHPKQLKDMIQDLTTRKVK